MVVFETKNPLTMQQVRERAPAVFQSERHAERSDRYNHIHTAELLGRLGKKGWLPCSATQSRVVASNQGGKAYAQHRISLMQFDGPAGTVPMLTLTNSHNARSSFGALAGILRKVCGNGMMVGTPLASMKETHLRDLDFIEGEFERVVGEAHELVKVRDEWKLIELDEDSQYHLAAEALEIRGQGSKGFDPTQLLRRKREEDKADNLWSVYNVVQEHILRGGYAYFNEEGRRVVARSIEMGPQAIPVNAALWDAASNYAEAMIA